MMLKLAVLLTLATVCFAQPQPRRPKIPETFSSSGGLEYHDNRGTFFGEFVIDRAQALNQGVENSTLKVEDKFEHYEYLERYDTGDRYVVRDSGSGDVHCQLEKVTGNLPMFWEWVQYAKYMGNKTFHEIVYDVWQFNAAGTLLTLLVPMDNPDVPKFLERRNGPTILGFEFRSFGAATPPTKDFDVPKECVGGRHPSRISLFKLTPPL